MSRSFQIKDKDHQKSKHVIRRKTTMMTTSTPKTCAFKKLVNTSLYDKVSSISSFSNGSKEKSKQSEITGNQEKNARKRKGKGSKKTQVHFFTSSSSSEENEWETYEQESIKSSAKSSKVSKHDDSPVVNLFCTPEKTREGPTAFETLHDKSPICGSYFEKNPVQVDNLLPINIPMVERNCLEEMDVDEPVFHRASNVKTYLSAEKAVKRRLDSYEFIKKCWCKYRSDLMLTDDELARLYNLMKFDPTLVGFYADVVSFLGHYCHSCISCRDLHPTVVTYKPKIESAEDDPIPPGMMRVRGSLDRNGQRSRRTYEYGPRINKHRKINKKNPKKHSGKSKQKEKAQNSDDIYNQRDETDDEFETTGPRGKRMTLSQFRQKQKMNKFSASSATEKDSTI